MKPLTSSLQLAVQPHVLFIVVATACGSALVLLTPPLQVPDEGPHFYRAFALSEARLVGVKRGEQTGDYLPRSLLRLNEPFVPLCGRTEMKTTPDQIRSLAAESIEEEDRVFIAFSNAAVHPPLPYVPQAIGIWIARVGSGSLLLPYYAGRLANLLVAIALVALAIARTPVARWSFLALALTPMTLFEMASLSADALTNAVAFLLIAQVLWCALGPRLLVSVQDLILLTLAGAAVGLCKQAYFWLPLAYFLIPGSRLGGRRRYWTGFGLVMGGTLLALVGWALIARNSYSSPVPGEVDPRQQLNHLLDQPADFLQALLSNFTSKAPGTLEEWVGVLGALDTHFPRWTILLEVLILAAVFVTDFDPRCPVSTRQSLWAILVVVLQTLTIFVIIHLTWDRLASQYHWIDVQGRYFIPLGPLAALAVSRLGNRLRPTVAWKRCFLPTSAGAAAAGLAAFSVFLVYSRYYVDDTSSVAQRLFVNCQAMLRTEGSEAQAVPMLEEVVRLNPEHAQAHYNLGVLLSRSRPSEAVAHYRVAIRVQPDNVAAHVNLANSLARLGNLTEAIDHYREALRLNPGDKLAEINLSRALEAKKRTPDR